MCALSAVAPEREGGDRPRQSLQTLQRATHLRAFGAAAGEQLNILQTVVLPDPTSRSGFHVHVCVRKTIYGQASRLISIGKLNASLRLHTRPITWSSSRSLQEPYGSGDLILWRVSRLDAFSVSPFRT